MTRAFLFLQGPSGGFFKGIADQLKKHDYPVYRINFCAGDQLFWIGKDVTNYRGKLSEWPTFFSNFVDQHTITDILLIGEQRSYHKVAIDIANKQGIQVIVTDFGYLRPDWITLEKNGMGPNSLLPRDSSTLYKLAEKAPAVQLGRVYQESNARMAIYEMLYHFIGYFFWFLFPHYKSFKLENPFAAYLGTAWRLLIGGKDTDKLVDLLDQFETGQIPFFIFPLQMENDFQIRAYSDFDSLQEPIEKVIRSFAENAPTNSHLILKVHPWDPGLKNWKKLINKYAELTHTSKRIHYIDGGDLKQITRASAGMVTVNSTSGFEALIYNCPVITLGQAIYDIEGLTFQGGMDAFWQNATPPKPQLKEAFINVMAASIQIRGVFYNNPGLSDAIQSATTRLIDNNINVMVCKT